MHGYLEYFTVKFLGLIVSHLPQKTVIWLGRLSGSLFYLIDRRHRNISLLNLKRAFGDTKTNSEMEDIVRDSFTNLCQNFFEVLLFPKLNAQWINKFVAIEGQEHLDKVRSQGKGGILFTAHFGNWELSGAWAALNGYSLNALVREQKQSRLNFLLNQYRKSTGIKVYAKGMAVRDLIGAFRRNEFVGILGDQDAGQRGVFIDFFNRPASTHPGPILLALKIGVPVLPCFIVRAGAFHKIYVNPPLHLEPRKVREKATEEAVKAGLEEFSGILEAYIRRHPGQWLWMHRRWKTQPAEAKDFSKKKIKILLLSDAKTGHLSQSRGIARGFPAAEVLEVKISFRNRFWKLFIPLLTPLLRFSKLIKFVLKTSLTQGAFKQLNSFVPEVIISTGSSLAAYNLLYGRITRAKKIVCMKPGIIDLKYFDLIIAPQHDHLPILKNVLNTFASPHSLRREDFRELSKFLKDKYDLKGDRFLGLLLGGETSHFSISKETIREIIKEVKKSCGEHNFKLLLAVSRRTPVYIEEETRDCLRDYSNLELFISPRQESWNPVGGFLGLSEIIVVTEDSISMMAEAASSGKKVIALQIDRKSPAKTIKHLETIQNLAEKGYLYQAEPGNLSQVIGRILADKFSPKILNDTERAIERVKEVLLSDK